MKTNRNRTALSEIKNEGEAEKKGVACKATGFKFEPAKADALEKLGEGRQALGIASGWVRAKLAPKAIAGGESVTVQEL